MKREQNRTTRAKEQVIEALKKSLGVVTHALGTLNLSRTNYYKWIKEDAEFAREVEEIQNEALDFAETALFDQIRDGNPQSTMFYLKTKGKKRGYTERSELDISSQGDKITKIEVEIVDIKDKNE
tara:strand:+ start:4071 stop:4445 length:375 start_codon:yes stop_codon:yes gene_type:complete